MLGANILYAKVVNNEAKSDVMGCMFPKAWCAWHGEVAILGQVFVEPDVGEY
jgi:hypothetical protein